MEQSELVFLAMIVPSGNTRSNMLVTGAAGAGTEAKGSGASTAAGGVAPLASSVGAGAATSGTLWRTVLRVKF